MVPGHGPRLGRPRCAGRWRPGVPGTASEAGGGTRTMSRSFPVELPLSRSEVDRSGADREDPALLETLWNDPDARVLALASGRALLAAEGTRLALLPTAGLPRAALRLYLGRTTSASADGPAGMPLLAVELDE